MAAEGAILFVLTPEKDFFDKLSQRTGHAAMYNSIILLFHSNVKTFFTYSLFVCIKYTKTSHFSVKLHFSARHIVFGNIACF